MTEKRNLENSYQDFHRTLIIELADKIKLAAPFNSDNLDTLQEDFLKKLEELIDSNTSSPTQVENGQWLLTHIVSHFPHIMPSVPRSLFWYFGGECLHFLGDEEIEMFQQIEEGYHNAVSDKGSAISYEEFVQGFMQNVTARLH